jgi:2,3-bisphosphoglycerate-independent phosphoglycerate mutase
MGNSEVGHLNLGAGSVVKQDLARIDSSIADGSFFENPVLLGACERACASADGRLHLLGLVSDGGVHSGWAHIEACIELAANQGVPDLVVHALTDGRDTLPKSSPGYIGELERWLAHAGRIGTVGGRYWGMDRDSRWDRTERAFDAIVYGEGGRAQTAADAVTGAHARGETDEFIAPTVIGDYDGAGKDDVFVTFNFRPDRMRQIVMALGAQGFAEFPRRANGPYDVSTMTRYKAGWPYPVAFPPREPDTTLAEVLARAGKHQLHVAETEKYAHVTYFFNGGREAEWEGEERRLVDSPREVPTYDRKPEMSAEGAASAFCSAWAREPGPGFDFGIINFANPDMVGHTGDIPAAVKAVEAVDTELRRVVEAVHASGGACLITADHGNADNMLEPDGSPNTAHSLNPVPVIVTAPGLELREEGILADVAPTLLQLLGMEQPREMTGESLIQAQILTQT